MKTELSLLVLILAVSFVSALILARPKSQLHTLGLLDAKHKKFLVFVTVAATVLCCTVPMNLSPVWNGERPDHRNQYEKITEAFLNGHLYFDELPDPALAEMDNPYDLQAREKLHLRYQWDHAYYNGRYYMYFGVVPVFLAFLPYRVITGSPLTSYHATQLFTAAFIIGLFLLMYEWGKKLFRELSLGSYLFLGVAFSAMSVWVAVSQPALYCTAITAGMATMIWGLYFWSKALWGCERRALSVIYATLGSLLGALTFGCRPPIGLANILIPGMMVYYLKTKPHPGKWLDLLVSLIPYALVGTLLMAYNYVRFGSIFEFGQSYQLTQVDLRNAPTLLNAATWTERVSILRTYAVNYLKYLIWFEGQYSLLNNGTLIAFPIMFSIFIGLAQKKTRAIILQKRIRLFVGLLLVAPFLILIPDVLGSLEVLSRYRMDSYWIFGLLCYVFLGLIYQTKTRKPAFSSFLCYLAMFTTVVSVLLILHPSDCNFSWFLLPENRHLLGWLS